MLSHVVCSRSSTPALDNAARNSECLCLLSLPIAAPYKCYVRFVASHTLGLDDQKLFSDSLQTAGVSKCRYEISAREGRVCEQYLEPSAYDQFTVPRNYPICCYACRHPHT